MAFVQVASIGRLTLPTTCNGMVDHDQQKVIVRGSQPCLAEERPVHSAADEDAEREALMCC